VIGASATAYTGTELLRCFLVVIFRAIRQWRAVSGLP
jgi:hypothetical protein